ncbi:MAG: hypothetical protein EYC70_00400 [Planctomycetota bacterium]|nr:MAG: hypothetical protein EYC70_00400 [Planctomycetota bacterium]
MAKASEHASDKPNTLEPQAPTRGRIVLVATPPECGPECAPAPAIVSNVHNATCVSVTAFPFGCAPMPLTRLMQVEGPDDLVPGAWCWPPR